MSLLHFYVYIFYDKWLTNTRSSDLSWHCPYSGNQRNTVVLPSAATSDPRVARVTYISHSAGTGFMRNKHWITRVISILNFGLIYEKQCHVSILKLLSIIFNFNIWEYQSWISQLNCRGHYVRSNVPGQDISAPKFSLCLPVPYVKEKSLSAGISSQLASFLLYSLSPFNPNPDILDNKDLLTELTKQYKVLESRRGSGIRKVLRSAAPTCPEVTFKAKLIPLGLHCFSILTKPVHVIKINLICMVLHIELSVGM